MSDRWKGATLGYVAAAAGVIAMDYTQKALKKSLGGQQKQGEPDYSLSRVGRQHREGESSTAAIGRILYQKVAGKEPQADETKQLLSTLVHWGYGLKVGGWYGLIRGKQEGLDITGGLILGTALWLFGDELAVPMLGLSPGPKSFPVQLHARVLGAHLAYGAATAATTQLLMKIV